MAAAWLTRLFSSSGRKLRLPMQVLQMLQAPECAVAAATIPGAGRGLVAARPCTHGELLLEEPALVAVPASNQRRRVCYHCLRPLPSGGTGVLNARGGKSFCSSACLADAQASYFQLEQQADLAPLEQLCEANSERFPLLAARLALMVAQSAMQQPACDGSGELGGRALSRFSRSSSSSSRALTSSSWTSNRSGSNIGRLSAASSLEEPASWGSRPAAKGSGNLDDPSSALSFLCFANVPPPPPTAWQAAHKLLLTALRDAARCREDQAEADALAAALKTLDINWYVAVLSRLHLNTFKVQSLLPLDLSAGHAALAAMLQPDGSAGSGLWLLASLFNHSCEPNVNVSFDGAVARFHAARDIAAGEQLLIAYIDVEQQDRSNRQSYLEFAYGFHCRCPRCVEEEAVERAAAPPSL